MPNPADHTGSPSRTTAAPMPGTLFADMKLETAFSISARFCGERLFCWAATPAAATRTRASKPKTGTRREFLFLSGAPFFTGLPRRRVYPKRIDAGNGRTGGRGCTEFVTPRQGESVDPGASASLPWRDEAKALFGGRRDSALGRPVGVRGCR